MRTRERLLSLLAGGQFHSGEALGEALGISRAAVWKQVRALENWGLEVHSVPGKGYRLARPLELLDDMRIQAMLDADVRTRLGRLEIFAELDSTNTYLSHQAGAGYPHASVCLAEYQQAGKGRRGRAWISPFGANLYLSLLWRFETGATALGGLSLAIGVALVRALRRAGADRVGLKWPNDILADGAKMAGILVELSGEAGGPCTAVIGVGVNVRMPEAAAARVDQAWTDLTSHTREPPSRNALAAGVVNEMVAVLATFELNGLGALREEWQRYDLVAGQTVNLTLPGNEIRGQALGVDDYGALLLRVDGRTRRYASGEVSLRMDT